MESEGRSYEEAQSTELRAWSKKKEDKHRSGSKSNKEGTPMVFLYALRSMLPVLLSALRSMLYAS
jgi:hypothetical protein